MYVLICTSCIHSAHAHRHLGSSLLHSFDTIFPAGWSKHCQNVQKLMLLQGKFPESVYKSGMLTDDGSQQLMALMTTRTTTAHFVVMA